MNFLAHIFLSGADEELMLGNFMADFVRASRATHYSERIREGMALHHRIDAFTDAHAGVRRSVQRLKAEYGRYAAVIVDVYYDHFLAVNWNSYSDMDFQVFCERTYHIFTKNMALFPPPLQKYLPDMISHNWLFHYGNFYGMQKALQRISERASFSHTLHTSLEVLKRDFQFYESDFKEFFPEIVEFVKKG